MWVSRRAALAGVAALAASAAPRARAQGRTVKIGVLSDFFGICTDLLGPGGVACVRQAVRDFGSGQHGFDAEVVHADHQNKPDVGSAIARNWYASEGVDMIVGLPNSSVALAAAAITTGEFTGAQCTPNAVNWTYDAYMLAKATGTETVAAGGKRWYSITTDNAFGNSLQSETAAFVQNAGGTVAGAWVRRTGRPRSWRRQ